MYYHWNAIRIKYVSLGVGVIVSKVNRDIPVLREQLWANFQKLRHIPVALAEVFEH